MPAAIAVRAAGAVWLLGNLQSVPVRQLSMQCLSDLQLLQAVQAKLSYAA
jgi:hypothetical protein